MYYIYYINTNHKKVVNFMIYLSRGQHRNKYVEGQWFYN